MKKVLHSRVRGAVALVLGVTLLLSLATPAVAAGHAKLLLGYGTGKDVIGPPIASCPAGSIWYLEDNGTGLFTQLGRVNFTYEQCAAADLATGNGWTTGPASMTIITAHGDRLLLSYEMTFHATPMPVPTTAHAQIKWVVAGGSGRFAAARGFGAASVFVKYTPDLTGAVSSSIWWGTIAY
jgi:hypothetical protein